MLYNKTREQLQRKEEQQRAEAEERHKAELKVRSLELEIRALKNSFKQVTKSKSTISVGFLLSFPASPDAFLKSVFIMLICLCV